ncbi:MFS transporter [Micromonospora sp. URMC 106]|uniref:MFS transporter n=1 Tax=Micromonospora sp. URMC 106 TaxID=3423408 RepID=UPI003F1DFFB4
MWRIVWRYLAVAVLARLADEGARVALLLLALAVTGSTVFGGLLVAAFMVPHVLAAPVVGALADRVRRRTPTYAAFLTAYGTAIAACAVSAGRLPAPAVLAVAVAGGCFAPLATGGLSSLLRDLVPADDRDRAYALDVMTYNTAGVCGPAVAALLSAALGPRPATVVIAACALVAGLCMASLSLPDRPPATGALNIRAIGGDALATIWRTRSLRAVTVATSLAAVSAGATPMVAALLAARYHASYATGALLSAMAVGGLLGSLAYARRPVQWLGPERVVMTCIAASAAPLAVLPLVPGVGAGLLVFAVSGFFLGPQAAALFASRDRHTPAVVHTQVFTLGAGLKITAAAAGAALAGAGAAFGADRLSVAVAGFAAAAAGIGMAFLPARHTAGAPDDI